MKTKRGEREAGKEERRTNRRALLVFWVGEGARAGLAVVMETTNHPVESRCTALAPGAFRVVLTVLDTHTHACTQRHTHTNTETHTHTDTHTHTHRHTHTDTHTHASAYWGLKAIRAPR